MSSPTEDEAPEGMKAELEERAKDVVEDGEIVTFEEHNEQRE